MRFRVKASAAIGRRRGGVLASLVAGTLALAVVPAWADVPYTLDLSGLPDDTTKSLIDETSELITLGDKPPPSVTALRARVRGDVERIQQVLNAYGYFDAAIEVNLGEDQTPVPVTIHVEAGRRFDVGAVTLTDPGGVPLGPSLSPNSLLMALKPGQPYTAQAVLDTEGTILAELGRRGRPFAKVARRDAVLDRAARAVNVTWAIDYGPLVTYGPVSFEGLERLRDKPARVLITWQQGDTVNMDEVEETRRAFVETGLFRTVTIDLDRPAADGAAPILIRLEEGKPRTIGGGLRYSTSEGAGVRVFWEHRNLLGGRESLRVTGDLAQNGYSLEAKARKPDFEWHGVDLVAQAKALSQQLDAYDIDSLLIGGGLEWRYSPQWFFSGGLTFEQSHIVDTAGTEDYTLVGLPMVARQDTSNNALDPTRGHRLTFSVTPYYDVAGVAGAFVISRANASVYLPLDQEEDYVLALRGSVGATFGGSTLSLPADKRFYAGGGDSIRGFGYQVAGPLGDDGKATGGKSIFTGGVEMRWRVTPEIGIVPFFDFGSVYEESTPDFGADLFGGAGLGLRYLSPIGPLRLDVATPVIGQRDSDDIVQIYISIGQAF
jgi:translocation and assembly module TamA